MQALRPNLEIEAGTDILSLMMFPTEIRKGGELPSPCREGHRVGGSRRRRRSREGVARQVVAVWRGAGI